MTATLDAGGVCVCKKVTGWETEKEAAEELETMKKWIKENIHDK